MRPKHIRMMKNAHIVVVGHEEKLKSKTIGSNKAS